MALGSTMGRVQRDVIGKTLRMAAAGIALGTMALLAVARYFPLGHDHLCEDGAGPAAGLCDLRLHSGAPSFSD
jgi:hypothetical protein